MSTPLRGTSGRFLTRPRKSGRFGRFGRAGAAALPCRPPRSQPRRRSRERPRRAIGERAAGSAPDAGNRASSCRTGPAACRRGREVFRRGRAGSRPGRGRCWGSCRGWPLVAGLSAEAARSPDAARIWVGAAAPVAPPSAPVAPPSAPVAPPSAPVAPPSAPAATCPEAPELQAAPPGRCARRASWVRRPPSPHGHSRPSRAGAWRASALPSPSRVRMQADSALRARLVELSGRRR
jgi:hypothetical protein